MSKYKVLHAVEIGEKIRQKGEIVDQNEMHPATTKKDEKGKTVPESPAEWDSLMETGHIEEVK